MGEVGPTRIAEHRSDRLEPGLVELLWAFHQRYVVRSRESFVKGLQAADAIWTLDTPIGIGGFATVKTLTVDAGRRVTVIYTQWAFVDPTLRRRGFIHRVALRCWSRAKLRHPLRPVYWVFSASSVDGYIHMLRSTPVAYPRMNEQMPPHLREILDKTMRIVGGGQWDAETGTLRRNGEVRYLEGQANIDDTQPDVVFYRAHNPHQWRGDSLGCIAPATFRTALAYMGRLKRRR